MLTFTASKEIAIAAPPERVFAIVSDVSRHHELAGSGEVLAIRVLTPGPLRVGTEFEAEERIVVGPSTQEFVARSTVVEYERGKTLSWIPQPPQSPQPRRIQWWFRLTPTGRGTHVAHSVEVDMGPIMNTLGRLPYRHMRGKAINVGMERTLLNLKARAEERAALVV